MIVVEMTEDKFGQAIKDITCMEEKLEGLKHIFETESMGYRRNSRSYADERDYRDYDHRYDREPRDSRSQNYGSRYL